MNTAGLSLPEEVIQNDDKAHIVVVSKPIGVVAAIAPWNWPLMIAIWQIAPALRAGNTVVLKPSPLTPLATLRMVELLAAVLPPGVLNCVAALDDVAPILSRHPDVGKVSFTGSTETGKKVMVAASATLKRLTLELGGNDAAIILPDVDPAAIAEGLFWGAFINNGQTCACLKRLYVHEDVYDAVCAHLADFVRKIPMGDGMDEASILGPVQNAMQFAKVRELVEDAVAKGGRILTGGAPAGGPGYFYPITLVAEARHGMRLVDEEQFGPALPILRYRDLDEAIRLANDSTMGLGASVWSGDAAQAAQIVSRLEVASPGSTRTVGSIPTRPSAVSSSRALVSNSARTVCGNSPFARPSSCASRRCKALPDQPALVRLLAVTPHGCTLCSMKSFLHLAESMKHASAAWPSI